MAKKHKHHAGSTEVVAENEDKGESAVMNGVAVGRIVHYVLSDEDLREDSKMKAGEHRAAIIVNDWKSLGRDDGYVNLQVFLDGANDGHCHTVDHMGIPARIWEYHLWVTSVVHSEGKEPGTWHWPAKSQPASETKSPHADVAPEPTHNIVEDKFDGRGGIEPLQKMEPWTIKTDGGEITIKPTEEPAEPNAE
jgi:hypothetical protein